MKFHLALRECRSVGAQIFFTVDFPTPLRYGLDGSFGPLRLAENLSD